MIKIENATNDDLDFIIGGINEICKIEKEPFENRSLLKTKIHRRIKNKEIIVAKVENKTIGFLEFLFSKKAPFGIDYEDSKQKYCWVNNMYILKDFRGKGIGRLFLFSLEKICNKRKIKKIMFDVFEINKNAKKFYEIVGYKTKINIMEKKLK